MKKIILTGGGTAGHVMPHLALIPHLLEKGYHIDYIGSKSGIERSLIEKENLPYYSISSGKLRRYFSFKNFTDVFSIIIGIIQSIFLIRRLSPSVVFSKGGFVTVPVVIGAWINRVPIVIHESDLTPGLANKIALKFTSKICTTFPETLNYLPKNKGVYTGAPIRETLFTGDKIKALEFTGLSSTKPIILVTGGSLGAKAINHSLREILPDLLSNYQVIHLCGKENISYKHENINGYKQYEFIGEQMADIYAASTLVISRAGSNTITELLALKKLNILIPLPANQSRGDQLQNADIFQKAGFSKILLQETLTPKTLLNAIDNLMKNQDTYIQAMSHANRQNGVTAILSIIENI